MCVGYLLTAHADLAGKRCDCTTFLWWICGLISPTQMLNFGWRIRKSPPVGRSVGRRGALHTSLLVHKNREDVLSDVLSGLIASATAFAIILVVCSIILRRLVRVSLERKALNSVWRLQTLINGGGSPAGSNKSRQRLGVSNFPLFDCFQPCQWQQCRSGPGIILTFWSSRVSLPRLLNWL